MLYLLYGQKRYWLFESDFFTGTVPCFFGNAYSYLFDNYLGLAYEKQMTMSDHEWQFDITLPGARRKGCIAYRVRTF